MNQYEKDRKSIAKFLRGLADIIESTDSLVSPITLDFVGRPEIISDQGEFVYMLPPKEQIATITVSWNVTKGGIPMFYVGEGEDDKDHTI